MAPEEACATRPGGTAHARRVIQVVEAFTYLSGPDHGPSEIAATTGLHPTVVYRILQSGTPGLFVRGPAGRYRLGPGAARLGMQAMAAAAPSPRASRLILERLSRVLDGLALLWVLSPYGQPGRVISDAVGRYSLDALGLSLTDFVQLSSTLRVGASGRAIAAHLPSDMISSIAEEGLPAAAGAGALQSADFRASLETVRQTGYAVGSGEMPGWAELAAPVLWGDAIYGAVSVLMPAPLMPQDLQVPVAATMAAARKIESGGTVTTPIPWWDSGRCAG